MDIRKTYLEICKFLEAAGGPYANQDTQTYRDIIDALFDQRFRIVRAGDDSIKSFTTWWMIHKADINLVKYGGRPADVSNGSIVYVADHAGKGEYPGLIRFIRNNLAKKGVCWHHRYKQPGQFRYYPEKEGSNV